MSRNRPPDSNRRAPPASAQAIDTPALVVLALTAFFASLFVTLLVLRPETSDPTEPPAAVARSAQSAPRENPPPVDAPPAESIPGAEPKTEPEPAQTLQIRLEQLGIKCAEGANCYPD